MTWYQLRIKTNGENAEQLSDQLMDRGAQAVTLVDAKQQPLLEPNPSETPLWDQTWACGLIESENACNQVIHQLQSSIPNKILDYQIMPLDERDWHSTRPYQFEPLQFGHHLWITPADQQHAINDDQAIKVLLEPGLGFGTGTHATTALCLEWLSQHVKPGQTVIDYGCGSGILALAACQLGADKVFAIDHDPQALTATATNQQNNHISEQQLQRFYPNEMIPQRADILCANILAQPLIDLAPYITHLLKPQGKLILTGILTQQAEQVTQAYLPDIALFIGATRDDWVRLQGQLKSNFGDKRN